MDNYGKLELEILEMEVKKGDKGNKYVEFSGKSTKTDEVFTGLKAAGITGANLVKDFKIGDVVTIQHTLEVNYDENYKIEMNILGVGLPGEITECNTGFLRGYLIYKPKRKKDKGKDTSEISVMVIKRDFKGNVILYKGDNGKENTRRQMFKLILTKEEHIDLMSNEIGKREKSCAAKSELFIEYELEPNKEEGFVNIIPTHLSVLSLDSIMNSDNWEIPSIKSKKSKSKEVDYEDMDHDELVELAEKAGIEDADDYGKKTLIKKLKELDEKKSKKSDDTPDFGEKYTEKYGYNDEDEEPAFPE